MAVLDYYRESVYFTEKNERRLNIYQEFKGDTLQ